MRRGSKTDKSRRLIPVAHVAAAKNILWELLSERPDLANISHGEMPSWPEHCSFVERYPYRVWYLIRDEEGQYVGAIYLTRYWEIGIGIFQRHQRKGHAKWAILEVARKWGMKHPGAIPGVRRKAILANIAPANDASKALFEACGFRHVSNTHALDL